MRTLALWCFRHRRVVVVGWLALVVALVVGAQAAGTSYDNSLALRGTDSAAALQLLQANAPAQSGDAEQVVIATHGGASLTDPAVRAKAQALFGKLSAAPGVVGVVSPYEAAGAAQMNGDHTVAFATVSYAKTAELLTAADGKALVAVARSFRTADLDVAVEGAAAAKAAEGNMSGVGVGIIAALVVLLLIFGSVLAAVLPLISALLALPAAISVIGFVSHVVGMPDFAGQVVVLIGLGVGVDYALFLVTRMRHALQEGQDVESAIVTAMATTGRAVLFAGAVVCAALLGMLTLGVGLISGIGVAASIGVLFTVATALTLVPALLGFFGTRVLSRRQRRELGVAAVIDESGLWWRWSSFVARRPLVPALVALVVVGALAAPIVSLRMGSADAGNGDPSSSSRQAYDLLARGFGPGFNGPLEVAVSVPGPGHDVEVERLATALSGDSGVSAVSAPHQLSATGNRPILAFTVFPATAPQDAATTALVQRLRARVIPRALAGSDVRAYIGGAAATAVDFNSVLAAKMPLFIGIVVLLSFLLLVVLLRSILIPLTAAVMNVLSTCAVLGTLTAAYVWGWGGNALAASRPGPIEAGLAVMVFAILFGLSMDYQVFLATRMQEEWRRTRDNALAVKHGLAVTGRTITAAAVIMIAVFGSFILGGDRLLTMFGVGLTTAVFVDAFLVRVAIVPAVMFVLGRSNWWLPRRLAAVLPRVAIDEHVAPADAPVLAGVR